MSDDQRQTRLVEWLSTVDLAGMLVTELANIRYLTGFVGTNAVALIAPERRLLFTDSRYIVSAKEQTSGVKVVLAGRDLVDKLGAALAEIGGPIGIEADDMTLGRRDRIAAAAEGVELRPVTDAVERLRLTKSAEEVAAIRAATEIADVAFDWVASQDLVGMSERDVAWELEGILRREGADGPSFPIIVAAGANGARPHAVPSRDPIPAGTLVVVDMGALLAGYHSDCTRTYATGPLPDDLSQIHAACLSAQVAAVEAVRPGITCGALDEVARGMIRDAGFGDAFGHGLGHGVGLHIHERPWVRPGGDEVLVEGMAITVEPGIYLEGVGGVRIEDLVIVTADGGEVLTKHPRELAAS